MTILIVKMMRPRRYEDALPMCDQGLGLPRRVSQDADIETSFRFAGIVPEKSHGPLIHPGALSKGNTKREGPASWDSLRRDMKTKIGSL